MRSKKTATSTDLEVQKKVWDAICMFPGLYSDELQRVIKAPLEQVEEVLTIFEEDKLVVLRHECGKKQYFPFVTLGPKEKKIVALIHKPVPKAIVKFLLGAPHSTMKEIQARLNLTKEKVSPCMDELFRLGIIVLAKDTHRCNITTFQIFQPEIIEPMLIVKERSLRVLE